MSATWLDLGLVIGLVATNAALSGTEMALVSLGPARLEAVTARSERGRRVADVAASPSRYLSALQLGITLAGFLASASAAVELSASVAPWLDFLGGSAHAVSVIAVTVFVSALTLVFGELVPKRVAMVRAEEWSLLAVVPLTWFMRAVRPLLRVLEAVTDGMLMLTGNQRADQDLGMTNDDLRGLIAGHRSLEPVQRKILFEAIAVADRSLRHILIPRRIVVSVDVDEPAGEALERLRTAGVSRAPLVDGDLDHPIGQVHVLDLVDAPEKATLSARPVLALPETLSALRALRRMQASRTKLAVVIDEHGGTAGIVTIEDIVEELVGDIDDGEDKHSPIGLPGGGLVLPGDFPIHRTAELDIELPCGPYVTVAGLVLEQLGHLPQIGERVALPGLDLEVTGVGRHAITAVTIRPSGEDRAPGPGGQPSTT